MIKGKLIVITGFTASGKDTVVNELLKSNPELKRVITHTSRSPRVNEKHGYDYYFVKKSQFNNLVLHGEMLEYVSYENHFYGTTKNEISQVLNNKEVIWRIDMERVAILEDFFLEKFGQANGGLLIEKTTKILLKPESWRIAQERYKNRDPKSFNEILFKKRLEWEISIFNKYRKRFPHVIVNKTGKLNLTLRNIQRIINL